MDFKKPQSVTLAVGCLYLNLIISILSGVANIFLNPEHLAKSGMSMGSATVFALIVFVIMFVIYFSISHGKNWARILFLVMFVLGLLGFVLNYQVVIAQSGLVIAVQVVSYILQLVALILLYQKASNSYFKAQSMPCPDEPKEDKSSAKDTATQNTTTAEPTEDTPSENHEKKEPPTS
jgi:signal transduction histidine kinase